MRWLTPAAIVVAGALCAGTVAVVFRWETLPGPRDSMLGEPTAIRVDRWTGTIEKCGVRFTGNYLPGPDQALECGAGEPVTATYRPEPDTGSAREPTGPEARAILDKLAADVEAAERKAKR